MNMRRAMVPMVSAGMAAAAVGAVMMKKRKKPTVQAAAGRAIKAVGEVVENFSSAMMKG